MGSGMFRNYELPEVRRPLLRKLLQSGKGLRAIEFHSPLSAMIGEAAHVAQSGRSLEFDLLWASGFTNAVAKALPDAELWLLERRLDTIVDAVAVTRKPFIVDVDTGGDTFALGSLCGRLEQLGVSAVVVEDKRGIKRTSLADDVHHDLEDPQEFTAKLAAAKGMLKSKDLMIFARTESLISGHGMREALMRAEHYLLSDADGLVIHSKDKNGEEIKEFLLKYRELAKKIAVTKPVVCIPTAYNHIHDTELFAMGASIVIHANHLARAAFKAMQEAAKSILTNDRSKEADPICASVSEILDAVGTGEVPVRTEVDSSSRKAQR
jgi:2-methylisocitrate lyase-like PEP mutase family enzyme